MKKILIIGGCGYIGSKLFTHLVEQNYQVETIDLEWFGNRVNPKNLTCDFGVLPKKFYDKYNVIILLAGHSTVGMCAKDVIGSFKNNIESFVSLQTKLRKQKFIFASTYLLYDSRKNYMAKETDIISEPNSIYSLTKDTIERYASFGSCEFYGLRLATVNGFSPNLRTNQIINKLFLTSKSKKKITIYNQNALFSILGINDLCRAVTTIISGGDNRGIYNLKSFDTTLNHLIKKMNKIGLNTKVAFEKSETPQHHVCSSSEKFEKTYNFRFEETQETILKGLVENYTIKTPLIK